MGAAIFGLLVKSDEAKGMGWSPGIHRYEGFGERRMTKRRAIERCATINARVGKPIAAVVRKDKHDGQGWSEIQTTTLYERLLREQSPDTGHSFKDMFDLFAYDPDTGILTHKTVRPHTRKQPGDEAGSQASNGIRRVMVDGIPYLAHHVAWMLMTGFWPERRIFHMNGDKSDNRWENLREEAELYDGVGVPRSNNASGHSGVHFAKNYQRWIAYITVNYKRIHLGYFQTKEEAIARRKNAEKAYWS